jgi:hypothetical protein
MYKKELQDKELTAIPKARSPENAPAILAALKNMACRN